MKLIELHILQTFPVSCLNRDDLNSPKTAIFGGVQRARVSSQCWKRAIREHAAEYSARFQGNRTRLIVEPLRDAMIIAGMPEADALDGARKLAEALATYDKETFKKSGKEKVKTLYFSSPAEFTTLATAYAETKDVKKAIKAVGADILKDAADIALFGRMVANDPSLNVEGAAMFGHALSTHKVDNEIDFFAAVDDLQSADESGAGMTGTLEFNSATYYRFAALNVTMLEDTDHLAALAADERREVIRTFIEATLKAVPSARNNSMNAATLPACVLGIVRETGQPLQLINAFEKAVRPARDHSLGEQSTTLLRAENERMKTTWGLQSVEELWMPDVSLADFLTRLTAHV